MDILTILFWFFCDLSWSWCGGFFACRVVVDSLGVFCRVVLFYCSFGRRCCFRGVVVPFNFCSFLFWCFSSFFYFGVVFLCSCFLVEVYFGWLSGVILSSGCVFQRSFFLWSRVAIVAGGKRKKRNPAPQQKDL